MIATNNFHPDTDPKLKCTCNHPDCDKRSVSQRVLDMAQVVRDDLNVPMAVTSGGRCPLHPKELHRTIPADHQKQQGIDIGCTDTAYRGKLVRAGIKAGFNAIGVAATFIHLGYRPELNPNDLIMWTY